jgi:hypothetical protein
MMSSFTTGGARLVPARLVTWSQVAPPPCSQVAAIAGILVVSERSVEKHVGNIFSKVGLAPSDADHRRVLAVLRCLES